MINRQIKMLYLIHVPWGWIKQRPHFIAEKLNDIFDVIVCYPKYYKKKRLVNNQMNQSITLKELFVFPFQRFKLIKRLNNLITRSQLANVINEADVVWVTHPLLFETIENILPEDKFLIYDCMDDALEFTVVNSHADIKKRMSSLEKRLVSRCGIIFASSENLRHKLAERYQLSCNAYVINNAIHIQNSDISRRLPQSIGEKIDRFSQKKLMYVGTISEWIDTELILESLRRHPKGIVYLFIGPAEVTLPDDDRIIYFPPVEHQYLPALMKKADVLIMPFKVNELIKSVNPIKIYEYIYSCKPTISVGYEETKNFKDYVYTYQNHNEYHLLLEKLVQNKLTQKKSSEECEAFAKNHTWHKRTEEITQIIQRQLERN